VCSEQHLKQGEYLLSVFGDVGVFSIQENYGQLHVTSFCLLLLLFFIDLIQSSAMTGMKVRL